jgi:MoaA/NifB/PqqE/SkfB family radical SAM enzyme
MLPYVRVLLGILQGSRSFGGPVQMALNLTNRCNIRCIHCYFYSPRIENPNLFDVRKARRQGLSPPGNEQLRHLQRLDADTKLTHAVIDDAISMGTRRLQFGGNGEPFMHPSALEFMARAKRAGCYCIAYTNGVLLDRATVDELVRMGFDDLRVTTMAGTGETYLRTHPGSTEKAFGDLRQQLLYLRERRDALRTDRPKVRLACVVVTENCDGLSDFGHFAAELRADMVEFRPFESGHGRVPPFR